MGPEAKIQNEVVRWAQANGIIAYKFHEQYRSGAPDRLFALPNGICAFIEFKAPGKHPTLLQQRELNRLAEMNHFSACFDNANTAITMLKRLSGINENENNPSL